MRFYLIDADQNEKTIDLVSSKKIDNGMIETNVIIDQEEITIYFKSLVKKTFYSLDKISWKKTYIASEQNSYFDGQDHFKVFKGFKPSGLFSGNAGTLVTQMPGKIVKILVKENDIVKKGDTLVILEAMKMENEIKAAIDGTVKSIQVEPGKAVESGVVMMEIE